MSAVLANLDRNRDRILAELIDYAEFPASARPLPMAAICAGPWTSWQTISKESA